MATLKDETSVPDHMLDSSQFMKTIHNSREITRFIPSSVRLQMNPCKEIPLRPANSVEVVRDGATTYETEYRVYGHKLKVTSDVRIKVWTDGYGDMEVVIKQLAVVKDVSVRFGPVRTSLSELFSTGHWMEVRGDQRDIKMMGGRKMRVYLTDGTDRYRVGSLSWDELQNLADECGSYDLGTCFSKKSNMMKAHSTARPPKPVIKERIVERDPFEVLSERYPSQNKKPYGWGTMVGNRTLRERFEDHLRAR